MADSPSAPLVIRLFGPCEVLVHGQPLPRLRSRKGLWLLSLLALRSTRDTDRAWLAGTLWPDSTEAAAFANLRSTLKDLRRALGPEAARLHAPDDTPRGAPRALRLDLEGVEVDVLDFDAALAAGDPLSLVRAVALYGGPLLEECAEVWAIPEREAREQGFLRALEQLAQQALDRGDVATAEGHLRRSVAVDPLRESAQRALMRALAIAGNAAAAMEVYRDLRLRLHRELNAEPDPETQALFQQIRARTRENAAPGWGKPLATEDTEDTEKGEKETKVPRPFLSVSSVSSVAGSLP